MKRILSLLITFIALSALIIPASASTIPTFSITAVVMDKTVTIQTSDFPANDTFTVTMGPIGSAGIDGVEVGTTDSGKGGSFSATYNIPASLAGSAQIAIRLESPTSGFFAFNWFWNNPAAATTPSGTTTPAPTTAPGGTAIPGYSGFPTFSIISVVMSDTVTIQTNNMPPNDTFNVTMGLMGTRGINGISVGTTDSGSGGVLKLTYNIPSQLAKQSQISIRLQSPTTGFFAFNWFWNVTAVATPLGTQPASTPGATTTPAPTATPAPTTTPAATGTPGANFPTFSITSVVKDTTVTIAGINFPPNDTFTVTMGKMGTKGVDGIVVGSQATGTGGSLTATYNIPAELKGMAQIAIRLESPTSGFFAYNFFDNQ